MRAAQVMAIIAEINRNPEMHKEPFSPLDFLPQWDQAPRKGKPARKKKPANLPQSQPGRSWESMLEQVKTMNAAFGGKVIKKDEHAGNPGSQTGG
jgi:hypothetical protein